MSKSISFYVVGCPKSQPRPRAFAFKKGEKTQVRMYDPGSAEFWKSQIAEAAREAGLEKFEGPVGITLFFSFPRPKGHFRKDGHVKDSAPKHHTQRGDVDNLAKAVYDALTTLGAWDDDAQIVHAQIDKSWALGSSQGGCAIIISEMG